MFISEKITVRCAFVLKYHSGKYFWLPFSFLVFANICRWSVLFPDNNAIKFSPAVLLEIYAVVKIYCKFQIRAMTTTGMQISPTKSTVLKIEGSPLEND